MVDIKTIDGTIEDITIKEYSKMKEDGTEKIMKIGRIQINGKGFTTFDDELMKAFVIGDEVSIDYAEVIKGDKTFYNIKGILPTKLVKREEQDIGNEPVIGEEPTKEPIYPNINHNPKRVRYDIYNTKNEIHSNLDDITKISIKEEVDKLIKDVDGNYGDFRINLIEVKKIVNGSEIKLTLYRHDPKI